MTQTEAMNLVIEEIGKGKKLSEALGAVYTKRNVAFPFNEEIYDVELSMLKLSTRAYSGIMRAKLRTVKSVIEYASRQSLMTIKSMGKNSCEEVLEAILDYAWSKMSVREKAEFLLDAAERNHEYVRSELM